MASLFTDHPCLPPVTDTDIDAIVQKHGANAPGVLMELEQKRQELIARAAADPLQHGWEFECWRDADRLLALPETRLLANLGGNGGSKTWWMIKRGVQIAFTKPNARVLFLHEDEDASRDLHQALAYYYLPPALKPVDGYKPKKTVSTNIVYDSKIGFSGNAFTTPIGGKVRFGFYRQDLKRFEGMGYTFVGLDEDAPLSWIETLAIRLGRAGGKMVWCFTAIRGITPAVSAIVSGAKTLQTRPIDSRVLPPGHRVDDNQDWPDGTMPYVQQGTKPSTKIIYFHSDQNPLAGYNPAEGRGAFYAYEELVSELANKPLAERERRAYGYSRKGSRAVFPLFGANHVVPAARMAEMLKKQPVTRYQIIDPAGARNFFMIWFAVDAHGRHYIYREWPDVPSFGEWALPADDANKWDGRPGPAQIKAVTGVVAYKQIILEAEGWRKVDGVWQPYEISFEVVDGERREKRTEAEEIFDRYVDPRSGATEAMASDAGESSVLDRFREEQKNDAGTVIGPALYLTPAISGKSEEDGLTQIDELMAYNPREPITALLNEPQLYVSDACQSTIWALQNYTAHDGPKAACKDPVDVVRYMALKKCVHVQASALSGFAGGGW